MSNKPCCGDTHEQVAETGKQIQKIFGLLQQLFNPPTATAKLKTKIGFKSPS